VRPATTICCSALALIAVAATPSRDTGPPALVPTRLVWTLALNSQLSVPPAYDETRVFFSLEHDRLVAYDIVPGKQLWLVESRPILQPAAGGDLVYVAEAARLVALNARDGSVVWELPTPEPLVLPPVWDNGWIIAVSGRGTIRALRASDGDVVWTRELGIALHAQPAFAADRVYLPAADGRIIALRITDGSPMWERRIGGQPNDILALDERLYAGSTDNYFYCLMTKDGRVDWRWRTGADVIGAPVSDGPRVYFVSLDNVLRSMNAVTGGQYWLRPLPLRPTVGPQLAGSTLVVVGQTSVIRAYGSKEGVAAPDLSAGDEIAAPPHVVHDAVRELPMVLFVTKHIAKGAAAALHIRSTDPPATNAIAPLPNPVMPAPMPATR
jgi:outer membrane protein assembly factor BamB